MTAWSEPSVIVPALCTIALGGLGLFFAWRQSVTARKQLFAALYDKRYVCITAILETITARETEIGEMDWSASKPIIPMEQGFRLGRLIYEAQLLFGQEVNDILGVIDRQLNMKASLIATARTSEGAKSREAGHEAATLAGELLALREKLVRASHPFLFVGDVTNR
jgi:hypothetical protein